MLQGRRLPPGVEEGGDPAERAVGAGGPHRRHAPASHDHGPRAHRRIVLLVHGDGFPGEHGFVDHEGGRLGDIGVGRHDVTLGKEQDIAGHHGGGGDLARSTVPQDPRLRCRHRGESGHGMVGTGLLHDAHGRVDDDHHGDDHRVGVVADRDRHYYRAQEHHDQRIAQLGQHPGVQGCRRGGRDLVAAVLGQSAFRLDVGEAVGRADRYLRGGRGHRHGGPIRPEP